MIGAQARAKAARLSIEDDGHGIVLDKVGAGLGRTLITRLSRQAGADCRLGPARPRHARHAYIGRAI